MPDFRITIDVRDVSGSDIDALVESILAEHGDEFDAPLGDFTVRAAQKEGDHYFARDPGDDDL